MRVILFDDDTMEPITVIKVPQWAQNITMQGGVYRIPVMQPLTDIATPYGTHVSQETLSIVTIKMERFIRKGQEHWFAFTQDSKSALLLKSLFLPGQISDVQECEREAFWKGLTAQILG